METTPRLSKAHAKRILQDWIEDNEHVALVKASWPDLHKAYAALKAIADSPEEPSPRKCPKCERMVTVGCNYCACPFPNAVEVAHSPEKASAPPCTHGEMYSDWETKTMTGTLCHTCGQNFDIVMKPVNGTPKHER